MPDVVAICLPGGPAFVEALQSVWAAGDAAFPVDTRLPDHELARVMTTIAPTSIIEADGERRRLSAGHPAEPGDALVIATSGTTGMPKGVVHTHEAVTASAEATSSGLGVDPSNDRWLCCLPLGHIGGLSVVTRSIITGTPVDVHPRFDATAVAEAATNGVTMVSLVTRALTQIDPTAFRTILLGGGPSPADCPSNAVTTYGLTETGSGVVYDRLPLDGVEINIADDGEIWLRGPMLLRAYRQATGGGMLHADPKDSEGWFATGDMGDLDAEGRLAVHGRKGDVIVTGGEMVWPERAEQVLNRQPGISEAAIVGQPHPEWGQEVVAFVVPEGSGPHLGQLREAVRSELPIWYAPRRVELVDALPRTTLGKLQRSRLR
ncbi:MAG: O-succinylbenzoic acid--CoA ligase [Acidimicrobiales bacterium]